MDDNGNFGLNTPKSVRGGVYATSTANKTKGQRHPELEEESQVESSLGLLSLNSVDLSDIVNVPNSILEIRNHQRQLATSTLSRASKVGLIPSKLLKPDLAETKSDSNFNFELESTISDTDVLLKNSSTPRTSALDNELQNRVSQRFSVYKGLLDTNVSTCNAAEEFRKISLASKTDCIELDSDLFVPAEEAASKLLRDELSWKNRNDVPVTQDLNSFQDLQELPSISMGEFFQQRSDNISELRASSPIRSEPLALIDSSEAINDISNVRDDSYRDDARSLSVTAIQRLLANETPNKVLDCLLNQNMKGKQENSETQKTRPSSDIFSLPVSRNTSYTSSFSDNEAVRVAVNKDKENIQPPNKNNAKTDVVTNQPIPQNGPSPGNRQTSPARSSSSLTSLPDGKLPIESTVSELVWGCVKVDRCVTKEFLLRNKTPKTLRLQCSLSTYEFKIRKDNRSDSDPLSACKFVLHGHESRSLIISYIPTKVGAAVDELIFAPLDSHLTQTKKQCIRLWGYGGYTNTEYQNAIRDNTGKYWLSLGRMDNRVIMEQSFLIKNTGNLPSFTFIKVVPKSVFTVSNLRFEPNFFVLLPNEEKNIKVTYTPNARDYRILKENLNVLPVTDLGKLEIVSGAEVNRARLRRLYRKRLEKGLDVDTLSAVLKEKIVGEVFPSDVTRFKESPNALTEILATFQNHEVNITIEQDPNQTLVAEYPEDSAIFHTLCENSSLVMNETVTSQTSCHLEPSSLVLLPPSKTEDTLFLISETNKILHFEVRSNPNDLHISPTDGALAPGETAKIKVKLSKNTTNTLFKVLVYVDNEVFESEVKVLPVRNPRKSFLE